MAAGELQTGGAADMDRHSPPPHAKTAATFGFTPAQQIMFQSSNMNGQRVVMVTPEVARSLGIAPGADGDSGTAIRIQEDSGDVSVSVLETEQDGMIDPDQFLAMELASGKAEAVVDDELTSLSWLHSKNILKPSDVKFRAGAGQGEMVLDAAPEGELEEAEPRGPMSTAPLLVEETAVSEFNSEESPTSDYLEELPEAPAPRPPGGAGRTAAVAEISRHGDGRSPPPNMVFNFGKAKRHPPHLPYDPKVHVHFKPPFSFSCLIFMSIEDSPQKAMPVKEIYNWVQEHFPFYQAAPLGWKNSVRHNLSLNKCFRKIEKSPGPGKGSLWTVDPAFRPHLIQALKRSPCVQETPVGASPPYRPWTAAATALGGHHLPSSGSPRRTPARRPPPPPPVPGSAHTPASGHTPGPGGDLRSTESLEEAAMAAVMSPSAPGGVPRLTPRRRPGRGGRGRPPGGQPRSQSDDGGPDPQLFPLLSRRLLSGSGDGAPSPAGRQGPAAADPAAVASTPGAAPAGASAATPATPAAAEGDDETTDGERPLMIVQDPPPPSPAPSSEASSAQARCKVKVVKRPRDQLDYHPVLVSTSRHGHGEPGTGPPLAATAAIAAKRQLVIIRRSPEEEHTYAVNPPQRQRPRLIHQHQQHQHLQEHQYQHHYPASVTMLLSDDEAFSDDSNLSAHEMISVGSRTAAGGAGSRLSPEEAGRRFVREGADLLLNLAGVAVSGAAPTAPHARGHLTTARGHLTGSRGHLTGARGHPTTRGQFTGARGSLTAARGQFTGARGHLTGSRGPLTTRTVIVRRGVGRPPGSRGRGRGSLSAAVSAIFR